MSAKPRLPALEVTTFKLRRGLGLREFIAANTDVVEWLLRQPGFRSRHIPQRADGGLADVLHWNSVAEGERAMHRLLEELAGSPVHDCIDLTNPRPKAELRPWRRTPKWRASQNRGSRTGHYRLNSELPNGREWTSASRQRF
jgi:hypothetical protein